MRKSKMDKGLSPLGEVNEYSGPLFEKLEWMNQYGNRWYYKKFHCPSCGVNIRTESWNEERCFGVSTILSDNTMPNFCPNCGQKINERI